MFNNQSGSRRWTHFRSALQLAIQRSAHKWTFEDFAECFPLYVEEDKNGASATFNSVSDYIEAQDFRDLHEMFKKYDVQENIDILHKIVTDAKDTKLNGDTRRDTWQDHLDPKIAVCARTIPLLTSEAARLRDLIAKAEEENRLVELELQGKVTATSYTNKRVRELLDKVDTVRDGWQKLPHEEIESWAVQTAEALQPTLR